VRHEKERVKSNTTILSIKFKMQKGMKIIFQRIKEGKEKYYAAEMSHEVKLKVILNI